MIWFILGFLAGVVVTLVVLVAWAYSETGVV